MKKIATYLFSVLASVSIATSCMDSETPLYTGTMICNFVNPARLTSDVGEILNITENLAGSIPDTLKRLMIDCDVLTQHEDDGNEYDIRLRQYTPVTIAAPVPASGVNLEELGDDALDLTLWNSGGYLNSLISFTSIKDSNTEHALNLVFDDTRSNKDTLFLKFTHNAFGESYDNPDLDVNKIVTSGRYFSYDLNDCIPADVKSIMLHIEFQAFNISDNVILRDKEMKSGDLKFTR